MPIFEKIFDRADCACFFSARLCVASLVSPIIARAGYRVTMKESMALEHGPFLPWKQWAQSCLLGHEKHALAILCPVTMACRAVVSQGVTARKTSVAQLAYDGCCDNGLVRPFHKVGHYDAWLHGVIIWRVAWAVGDGRTG